VLIERGSTVAQVKASHAVYSFRWDLTSPHENRG
jgi:hypothetical protein